MNLKKVFFRGLSGIPKAVFIIVTIFLIFSLKKGQLMVMPSLQYKGNPLSAYTTQYCVSIFLGFVFSAALEIYNNDSWSIAKQTIAHFILISITFFPCAIFAGWIEPHWMNLLVNFGVFTLIYVFTWAIQYFTWKNRIERLNQKLRNN